MDVAAIPLKKRRVALYARVSTADQKNGLDAQIRALRIFCEQNKIEEYELFADENQSGTSFSPRRISSRESGRPQTQARGRKVCL